MLLDEFFAGAACMSMLVIALFFIRFWRRTRDRLFLFFSAAFFTLMIERGVRAAMLIETDWAPYVYSIRLVAFSLILVAIIYKNRRS